MITSDTTTQRDSLLQKWESISSLLHDTLNPFRPSGDRTLEDTRLMLDQVTEHLKNLHSYFVSTGNEVPALYTLINNLEEHRALFLNVSLNTSTATNNFNAAREQFLETITTAENGIKDRFLLNSIPKAQNFYADIVDKLLVIEEKYQEAQRNGVDNSALALQKVLMLKNTCAQFRSQGNVFNMDFETSTLELLEYYENKFAGGREYTNNENTLAEEHLTAPNGDISRLDTEIFNTTMETADAVYSETEKIATLPTQDKTNYDEYFSILSRLAAYLEGNPSNIDPEELQNFNLLLSSAMSNYMPIIAEHYSTVNAATDGMTNFKNNFLPLIFKASEAGLGTFQADGNLITNRLRQQALKLQQLTANMPPKVADLFLKILMGQNNTTINCTREFASSYGLTPAQDPLSNANQLQGDLVAFQSDLQRSHSDDENEYPQ